MYISSFYISMAKASHMASCNAVGVGGKCRCSFFMCLEEQLEISMKSCNGLGIVAHA